MVNASKPLRETNSEAVDIIRSRASALRSALRTQSFRPTASSLPAEMQTDKKSVLSPRDIFGDVPHRCSQVYAFPEDRSGNRQCGEPFNFDANRRPPGRQVMTLGEVLSKGWAES